jgi:hypothetical protein
MSNVTEQGTEVQYRSTEVKTAYNSTWKKRIRENYRRPEVQDADNSAGFGIQKKLNV